jgi:hypothetical protein
VGQWLALSILSAGALCVTPSQSPGQTSVSEYAVKAAYLLNFGKFVRTPDRPPHKTFDICILGQDPFGRSLNDITSNESIDGRPVRIVRVTRVEAARECAVLYISSSEKPRIDEDLAAVRNSAVLSVSDSPGFLRRGGMIEFVPVANHVRFAVNLDSVHRSHIVLSSELLRVAASVTGGGTGQEVQP